MKPNVYNTCWRRNISISGKFGNLANTVYLKVILGTFYLEFRRTRNSLRSFGKFGTVQTTCYVMNIKHVVLKYFVFIIIINKISTLFL